MKKRLISCVSCQRGKDLWCFDEQICSLCKIHNESLQAECVIPPTKILEDAYYEVRQMVVWRDKLLILPVQINQRWVIYDLNTGKLEYKNFCKENHRSGSAVLIDDRLVLLPASAKDSMVILDLQKEEIIFQCDLRNSCFIPDDGMEIWEAHKKQGSILFLIRGSCYYGQIKGGEVCLVKIHTPEPLWCMDFSENNGWAVGRYGKYLYQFDEKGNLIKKFFIDLKKEIVRILVKTKYIFLLPLEGSKIWIFDRNSKQVEGIDIESKENDTIFPPLSGILDYWDYVEMKDAIWFLPMRHPLLIINKDTGRIYQKTISFVNVLSMEKYWIYCNDVRRIRKRSSFFGEKIEGKLKEYLGLIQRDIDVTKRKRESFGEVIWKTLMEKNYG